MHFFKANAAGYAEGVEINPARGCEERATPGIGPYRRYPERVVSPRFLKYVPGCLRN
jgi:hypothetical protein